MKPSTELFDLIRSLSKSEKRFFKLSSSLQSGNKNYLRIFDAIEKQNTYDEREVKSQFTGDNFVNHFPSEKNHLYKLILKSLRSYHSDNNVSSTLKQEIKNIEILYKKALYKECNKFLKRAKKLAWEHEKFYYLFELISWEKLLLEEAYEQGEFGQGIDKIINEEKEVIDKLRNLTEYHILYSKINNVFRREGFARNAEDKNTVEEVADYHLIKGKNTALSVRATTICFYIKGLCASTSRDYENAFVFFKKVRDTLDANPKIKLSLSQRYVRTLNNLIYCYIDNGDYENALNLIAEMRALKMEKGFDSADVMVKIFSSSYIAELTMYYRMGEFRKGIKIIEEVLAGLEAFGGKINKEKEIVFYYIFAYIYFGAGEFNQALHWINKVLNDNEQNLRQDIYGFARLFNLVIHFELGNKDLLEYIIKSTTRYLNKIEKDYFVEGVLLKYLKKLAKSNEKADSKKIFSQMKIDTDAFFQNQRERVVLDYFDFESWLESKIESSSFEEMVKSKNEYLI